MTLTTVRTFLEEIGAAPLKRFSQNFLVDANIVRKIVTLAHIHPGDQVLEIGPGTGILTEELLKKGASVFAVEIDQKLSEQLLRLQTEDGRLEVHQADFLKFPLLPALSARKGPWKVVANLPYHITSPIIEKLCSHHSFFSDAHILVQKEVADRLIDREKMGAFSVFVNTYATLSAPMKVSRHCFYPAPDIDSQVLHLRFHTPPSLDLAQFHTWVRQAFQQKRKILRVTLGIEDDSYALRRPETLTWQEWVDLFIQSHRS